MRWPRKKKMWWASVNACIQIKQLVPGRLPKEEVEPGHHQPSVRHWLESTCHVSSTCYVLSANRKKPVVARVVYKPNWDIVGPWARRTVRLPATSNKSGIKKIHKFQSAAPEAPVWIRHCVFKFGRCGNNLTGVAPVLRPCTRAKCLLPFGILQWRSKMATRFFLSFCGVGDTLPSPPPFSLRVGNIFSSWGE